MAILRVAPGVVVSLVLSLAGACGEVPDPARFYTGGDIGPLRVMTYNVQCPLCNGEFLWPSRVRAMVPMFADHAPDLLAAQELLTDYDAFHLHIALPQVQGQVVYHRLCRGNCDSAIYYRMDKFDLQAKGSIWLGYWPPRKVLWALLRQKSNGAHFVFASTHFDNRQPNQEISARQLERELSLWPRAGIPVILAGDFNSSASGRATVKDGTNAASARGYAELNRYLANAYDLSSDCSIVSNHPDPATNVFAPDETIDHIWLWSPHAKEVPGAGWAVRQWQVDYRWYRHQGAPRVDYPSDHWPIAAEVSFQPQLPARVRQSAEKNCRIVGAATDPG